MAQETSSNYLYLTIGTLVHTKTAGGEAYVPLFLLPVLAVLWSNQITFAALVVLYLCSGPLLWLRQRQAQPTA